MLKLSNYRARTAEAHTTVPWALEGHRICGSARRSSWWIRSFLCIAPWAGVGGCADGVSVVPGYQELPSPAAVGSQGSNLASDPDGGGWMSWIEVMGEGEHALKVAHLAEDGWASPTTVAEGDSFFVNWADFPSVAPLGDGVVVAHWLVSGPTGGVDYSVRVSHSQNGGASWSDVWIPHEDDTRTEHGFVSFLPWEGGYALAWLDGRDYARFEEEGGVEAGADPPEMALRFRARSLAEGPGPEKVLDSRVCDCCQTAAAVTDRGPVLAYRDRTEDEVRDISLVRYDGEGWTEPVTVHDDGWRIPACPVNGPSADGFGSTVALAWFSAAADEPVVRAAFSADGGRTISSPVRVDGGNPLGRAQVILLNEEEAVVSWLERVDGEAELQVRRVSAEGTLGEVHRVTTTEDSRSSGFPRMASLPEGRLLFSWTETSGEGERVRTAVARVPDR